MHNKHWKLFEPFRVKGLQLKNRIVMLPMGNKLHSASGEVTQTLIDYYQERAKGGVGLITVQASYITDEDEPSRLKICSDRFISGLSDLAETIKSEGTRVAIQISHLGFLNPNGPNINDLDENGIRRFIEAFGKAAERAKRAGFEAVEIHGANGYLISQFLTGLNNKRTDAYGGPLEKRMTFALQVYEKVREALGENFPIFFRINADEFFPGALSNEDAIFIAKTLEEKGIDLISLSAGKRPETREMTFPPMALPRGCYADLSEKVKKSIKIPVITSGRINDPILANSILEEGKADLIGMGRALIADPWLPKKALYGELDEIRKCIACNCCHGKRLILELPIRCAINPEAVRTRGMAFNVSQKKKKVLIAGGGPAGLECAHTLRQRGHEVFLFEKDSELGGKLRVAVLPPHKEEIKEFHEFLMKRVKREKIPVFLNHEVNKSLIEDIHPDVLVFATGGKPIVPDIPGLKKELYYTAEEALTQNLDEDQIIVLGGGMVGCEVAEFLGAKGKKITIIEMLSDLGMDMEPKTRKLLLGRIMERKPMIRTSTEIVRIEKGKVCLRDRKGVEDSSHFDAIVLSVGFSPNDDLIRSMTLPELEIHCIGDCVMPRGIFEATREGYEVGRLIGEK